MGLFSATNYKIKLQVEQNGTVYEVEAKDSITITREVNRPSTLTAEIIRNSMGGKPFTPEIGDIVAFTLDEQHNQFYGYIMETDKHDGDWVTITAYDQLWYMAQNQHDWVFEDMTCTEILKEICEMHEFGMLDEPSFEDTGYKIETLVAEGVTLLDTVQQAIDITKENTGRDFYIWDDYGSVSLTSSEWMAGETALEISSDYITDYSFRETALNDFYTAVVLTNKRDETIKNEPEEAETPTDPDNPTDQETTQGQTGTTGATGTETETDPENPDVQSLEGDPGETKNTYSAKAGDQTIEKFGLIIYYGDVEEGEDAKEKAKQILTTYKDPAKSLSLSGVQGDITVRGGSPVLVNFFDSKQVEDEKSPGASGNDMLENIRGWFTVESVTHNINQGYYTMDLECKLIKMYSDWDSDLLHDETEEEPEVQIQPMEVASKYLDETEEEDTE